MNIKEKVLECCEMIIAESDVNVVVTEELELTRESGIDSLGLVSLVLELEDALEIDLDEYLLEVRNCKTIKGKRSRNNLSHVEWRVRTFSWTI